MSYLVAVRSSTVDNFDGSTPLAIPRCTFTREGRMYVATCDQAVGIINPRALMNALFDEFQLTLDKTGANVGTNRPPDMMIDRFFFDGVLTSEPRLVSPPTAASPNGEITSNALPEVTTTNLALYFASGRIGPSSATSGQGAVIIPRGYALSVSTTGGTAGTYEVVLSILPFDGAPLIGQLCEPVTEIT